MGPFDSGGVCSMGSCFVYGMQLVNIGVQIRGPYWGPTGKPFGTLGTLEVRVRRCNEPRPGTQTTRAGQATRLTPYYWKTQHHGWNIIKPGA